MVKLVLLARHTALFSTEKEVSHTARAWLLSQHHGNFIPPSDITRDIWHVWHFAYKKIIKRYSLYQNNLTATITLETNKASELDLIACPLAVHIVTFKWIWQYSVSLYIAPTMPQCGRVCLSATRATTGVTGICCLHTSQAEYQTIASVIFFCHPEPPCIFIPIKVKKSLQ